MKDPNDNKTLELDLNMLIWTISPTEVWSLTSVIAYKNGVLYQAEQSSMGNILWSKVPSLDEAIERYGGKINE